MSVSAIVLPSGFHADSAWCMLTTLTYRPSSGVTYTAARPPEAVQVNRSPVGDHAGRSMRGSVRTMVSRPVSRFRACSFRVPSAIETYATRVPSEDTAGHCSVARSFVSLDSVPFGRRTHSSAAPNRPRTNTIRPSRATDGWPSGSGAVVTRSGSPPLADTRQRLKSPARSDEKTIAEPSGIHAGSRSQAGPDVICVHCPVFDTIHRSPRTLTASLPSRAYAGLWAPTPGAESGAVAACRSSAIVESSSIRETPSGVPRRRSRSATLLCALAAGFLRRANGGSSLRLHDRRLLPDRGLFHRGLLRLRF